MASGIKKGANRPKQPKHLRTARVKKFRNEDPEKLKAYQQKLSKRRDRKIKKKGKKR